MNPAILANLRRLQTEGMKVGQLSVNMRRAIASRDDLELSRIASIIEVVSARILCAESEIREQLNSYRAACDHETEVIP